MGLDRNWGYRSNQTWNRQIGFLTTAHEELKQWNLSVSNKTGHPSMLFGCAFGLWKTSLEFHRFQPANSAWYNCFNWCLNLLCRFCRILTSETKHIWANEVAAIHHQHLYLFHLSHHGSHLDVYSMMNPNLSLLCKTISSTFKTTFAWSIPVFRGQTLAWLQES